MSDHIGDANKMIPAACAHCGAGWVDDTNRPRIFRCGSTHYAGFNPTWIRSMQCMGREIDQLKEKLEYFTETAAFTAGM